MISFWKWRKRRLPSPTLETLKKLNSFIMAGKLQALIAQISKLFQSGSKLFEAKLKWWGGFVPWEMPEEGSYFWGLTKLLAKWKAYIWMKSRRFCRKWKSWNRCWMETWSSEKGFYRCGRTPSSHPVLQ